MKRPTPRGDEIEAIYLCPTPLRCFKQPDLELPCKWCRRCVEPEDFLPENLKPVEH